MNNNNHDAVNDDEKKDVAVCDGNNYHDDHYASINNIYWGIWVFVTSGCKNKIASLTIENNLDYIQSSSLRGKTKVMQRLLALY